MKFRIVEKCGLFYPQYKSGLFWKKIPVRPHTWDYRYVYYSTSYEQAAEAITVYKLNGDLAKPIIRIVE